MNRKELKKILDKTGRLWYFEFGAFEFESSFRFHSSMNIKINTSNKAKVKLIDANFFR